MGLLDQITGGLGGNAGQAGQTQQAGIAGALMQALQQHPGGVGGMLESMRQNGMSQHVDNWASGQQAQASPEQVQQGLGGTGIVENTAQRAGVSHEVAAAAIGMLLPAVIRHFAPGGQAASQGQMGGLAEQFLSRML